MEPHSLPASIRPRQFTLRAMLAALAILPPLAGGFSGALGPYVQLWLLLAIGIPALALVLLAVTLLLGYILLVLPVVALAQAVDFVVVRAIRWRG
jgi:hypothetical protein